MARGRPLPLGLRAGTAVMVLLAVTAVCAPWLATTRAWVVRGPDGLAFPALVLRPTPMSAESPSTTILWAAPIPHDPFRMNYETVLQPPSSRHWLGTDGLGRDLAARMIHGTRVSLAVGLLSAGIALLVGLPLGALAGYRGGAVDAAVSRGIEAMLCIPSLLLVLAALALDPWWLRAIPDAVRIGIVLGVFRWTRVARYLRAEFLRLRTSDVVASARAAGAGHMRIAVRHIIPAALAPVLVTAAFSVGGAISLEAALSFLGLGVNPPTPSWGGLLAEAKARIDFAWWLALFPGLALFLTVLGCNWIGEGLLAFLQPRSARP